MSEVEALAFRLSEPQHTEFDWGWLVVTLAFSSIGASPLLAMVLNAWMVGP